MHNIDNVKSDPLFWLSLMEVELEDYQLQIFLSLFRRRQNRLIVNKSRQCGLSFLMCLYFVVLGHIRGDVTAVFVSYKNKDSSDKIKIIKELINRIPQDCRQKIVVDNRTNLVLSNGAEVLASGKSQVRGTSSAKLMIVLLDEFAFYGGYDEPVYTSVQGLWTRAKDGSSLALVSTPYAERGKFWEIWQDKKTYRNFQRFMICWWHYSGLVKKGMMAEAKEKAPLMNTEERVNRYGNATLRNIYRNMSISAFQQEYEAAFSSLAGSYFGFDSIDALFSDDLECCETFEEIKIKYRGWDLYAGYDVASAEGKDYSALVVLAASGDQIKIVFAKKYRTKFKKQKEILKEMIESIDPNAVYIERNGIGMNLAEDLEEEYSNVKGYTTSQKNKHENFASLKKAMEDGDIQAPSDKDLMLQLQATRLKTNTNGSVSINIERSNAGHGDTLMALTLALRCVKDGDSGDYLGFGRVNL